VWLLLGPRQVGKSSLLTHCGPERQYINLDDLARDAGVSPSTVKGWLSVLEDSFLIRMVQPEHRNRSKRLTKSPKLYFLDTGLAAFLAGWKTGEQLRLGAQAGAAFETHVFSEILKRFRNRAKEVTCASGALATGRRVDVSAGEFAAPGRAAAEAVE